MKSNIVFLLILTGSFLTGCQAQNRPETESAPGINPIRNTKNIMDARNIPFVNHPDYRNFSICYGHTCNTIETLQLSEQEWGNIRALFEPASSTAEKERIQIAAAIGAMENLVGSKTGTSYDQAENFPGLGQGGQMDCVDESTNTSVYLTMMQTDNLFRWHRVQRNESRGISTLQVPHFTAVIRDMQDGVPYAVDSWFLPNGASPFIVPLSQWKDGWRPEQELFFDTN